MTITFSNLKIQNMYIAKWEVLFLTSKSTKDGYEVIFIGLPCQVAALRTYLKIDFRNLILVDIICHGTPPQVYLDEHIHYFENKKAEKLMKSDLDRTMNFIFH